MHKDSRLFGRRLAAVAIALAFAGICSTPAWSQQVPTDPTSSHIFPAGGRRGTKVAVRVGGECLPPYTRFRLFGPSVTAAAELGPKVPTRGDPSPRRRPGESHIFYPKEWLHSIDISDDAPLGMKLWRVSCARGGTGGRPFIVGDLAEFIETESNSTFDKAEPIALPITVNGQIDGERDLDYYRFSAQEGEVVAVDVLSCRLGSPLEPAVEFFDEAGQRVAAQEYRQGADPVLVLRVPRTGTYRLMFAHLGFQGGPQYVYRATISTAPYAPYAFPAGARAGNAAKIELFALTGAGAPRATPFDWTPAADARGDCWLHAGLPCFNSLALEAGDLPDLLEQEGNDGVAGAQAVQTPANVHGRFLAATDEDWYRFSASKDSLWSIECRKFPAASASLPIVTVTTAEGAPLAAASMADDPRQACRLEWRAPADGAYCLRLRDVQQGIRGGPDFIYRLTVRPSTPGFELRGAADFANVVQGGRGELEIKARRTGGFAGPIDLTIDNLPAGLTFEPAQIPAGVETVRLAFVAEDQARPWDGPLVVRGRAHHEAAELAAVLQSPYLGRDADGVSAGPDLVEHVHLTLRHKPLLRLYCNEAYQYAYRGTVYPYLMEVERLQNYNGPIQLEIADRQIKDLDGVEVRPCTIEAGQTQIMLPLYLPESMHINVQAHSNVYAQAWVVFEDAWGQRQSQALVSEMRCMIRPLPTVVRLAALDKRVHGKPGETIACRLKLDRTSLFAGAMNVELVEPAEVTGWTAEPAVIAAGQTEVQVRVRVPANAQLPSGAVLKFRATGEMPGYVSIVSEASVPASVD